MPVQKGKFLKAVPWYLIVDCQVRADRNHNGQTLNELRNRGGLAPNEILALINDRSIEALNDLDEIRLIRFIYLFNLNRV